MTASTAVLQELRDRAAALDAADPLAGYREQFVGSRATARTSSPTSTATRSAAR